MTTNTVFRTRKSGQNTVADFISSREPFQVKGSGNAGRSFWGEKRIVDKLGGEVFVVFSYGHHYPVGYFDEKRYGWVLNSDKSSPTTHKQITSCKFYLRRVLEQIPTHELQERLGLPTRDPNYRYDGRF